MPKLLILGGTSEAAALATAALQIPHLTVISSLAGRTQQPIAPAGQVRSGGFGGEAGLRAYLEQESINFLIDATHPFAQQISEHGVKAAAGLGIPYLRLDRSPWSEAQGDRWLLVQSHLEAAALLPKVAQRIFLTIGRQELKNYAHLSNLWFLMRSIDPPDSGVMPPGELILAKGPFSLAAERELLLQHRIGAVVSKNSGGAATYAKIVAARELGLPVVMIDRPKYLDSDRASQMTEALQWLEHAMSQETVIEANSETRWIEAIAL
jgi:precorrin-6A/cobalt-precorrin-6A reductase